ncbi:MAG: hypothetical protein NTW16_11205 [Bacteroidetes bacterium]|nr:hypothetical protein [Bacteroidota bacterium]
MTYTIHIHDKSKKAKSIINMLKTLEEDYDFIEVIKEPSGVYPQTEELLQKRYKEFLDNPTGKDWNELKKQLGKL